MGWDGMGDASRLAGWLAEAGETSAASVTVNRQALSLTHSMSTSLCCEHGDAYYCNTA